MKSKVTIKGKPVIDIYESFDGSYWFITEKCYKQDSVIHGKVYEDDQILFGYAKLSACPEFAEFGYISETELKSLGNRVWKVPRDSWDVCPEVEVTYDEPDREDEGAEAPRPVYSCSKNCKEVRNKMAWRPNKYLIEGELDNTQPGRVTGWMLFAGVKGKVTFDLQGNFHRDIRGTKIHFRGDADRDEREGNSYMNGFARHQTGKVGDMTAGLPPADYVSGRAYLEWYGHNNGRVVLELEQSQVEVIGKPLAASDCEPVSRQEQNINMVEFLQKMAEELAGGI